MPNTAEARSSLLTVADVAAELRCSESSAYAIMHAIPHMIVGGRLVRVTRKTLDSYLASREVVPRHLDSTRSRTSVKRSEPGSLNAGVLRRPIVPRTKPRQA
jgi:hypothetical protein